MKITKKKYRCPECDKTGLKGKQGVKQHYNQKHPNKEYPQEENLSISSMDYKIGE